MVLLLLILTVIVCILLGAIVMVQNPKGGGLTSGFSSSSQLMGVQKTGDFLEKGTWILAIALMILSLAINVSVKGGVSAVNSLTPEQQKASERPSQMKNAPAQSAPLPGPLPPPSKNGGKK